MFERERLALYPEALESNRAGAITQGQRSQLWARATGAFLGLVGTGVFAVIAWWVALTGPRIWLVAALIATGAAPLSLWGLSRIWADLRTNRVMEVTGQPIITFEDEDDRVIWIELRGRRIRIPFAAAGILQQPGPLTAYYTPRSRMLVNLAPAQERLVN